MLAEIIVRNHICSCRISAVYHLSPFTLRRRRKSPPLIPLRLSMGVLNAPLCCLIVVPPHSHNSRKHHLWSDKLLQFYLHTFYLSRLIDLFSGTATQINGLQKNYCAPRCHQWCCGQHAGRSESSVCLSVCLSGKTMFLCSVWVPKIWANKFTASVSSIIEIFTFWFVSKWQMVWHFGMSCNDV